MRRGLFVGVAVLVTLAASSVAAPAFAGAMTFPQIEGPADPEEYSWEMDLGEGQALRSVDDRHAEVYYVEDDVTALTITAESAHDVDGSTVPTSLSVSDGNVITLTVHHRDGNPAAGGASFEYPVIAGEGWEGGSGGPILVAGPKDEQELKEEQERIAREKREALVREQVLAIPARDCLVPRLKGRSLKASKRLLREARCLIDDVRKLTGATVKSGMVVRQSPKPGRLMPFWTDVDVTLGS